MTNHPAHALDAYRLGARGESAFAEALPRPICPQCGGSGYARTEVDGIVTMGRCRCQMLPDRIHLFNQAGIPARYIDATFVSFAQTPDGRLKDLDPSAIRALGMCSQFVDAYLQGALNKGLVPIGAPCEWFAIEAEARFQPRCLHCCTACSDGSEQYG